MKQKFTVLYSFEIKPEHEIRFMEAWENLTQLIYQYEGSYGSRLHKAGNTTFIGYAQWPDKKIWEESGQKLPPEADPIRQQLRDSCVEIKTLYELEVVKDLIQNKLF